MVDKKLQVEHQTYCSVSIPLVLEAFFQNTSVFRVFCWCKIIKATLFKLLIVDRQTVEKSCHSIAVVKL